MGILRPCIVSSRSFTVSEGVLSTEISDLGPGFDFGRVYDDACDEGLTVHSERTGREVVFAIDRTVRDRDNDIQCWELVSVTPGSRGHKMVIFND